MKRKLILYIDKKPPLSTYEDGKILERTEMKELMASGNHWRKIINIFAKLAFGVNDKNCRSWQEYRDSELLRDSDTVLVAQGETLLDDEGVHLICGKKKFESMSLGEGVFRPLDEEGKVRVRGSVFQTPYFDYRQFPNKLIEELLEAIQEAYD